MKLKFTLFVFLFIGFQQVNAQLPDNSLAPDFTVEDINGVSHNLYDLLDEGKTVILDVFATWCGPCWSYHQGHVLADIYNEFGPDGENDMFVMAIEADGLTNEACLFGANGCNETTVGDWTEGVPYPIANSNGFNNLYNINYFPTIYIIYPNRLVKELGQQPYENIVAERENIPKLSAGINPELTAYRAQNGSVCGISWPAVPYFLISNMGDEVINSCDVNVYKNGEVIWTKEVTEPVGSFQPIVEIQVGPTFVNDDVVFEAKLENINGDPNQSFSTFTEINFSTNSAIYISAQMDSNSEAHSNRYEIINPSGDVVHSGSLAQNNALIERVHFMEEAGCHSFIVYDLNGDGVNGEIKVTDGDGKLIYINNRAFDEEDAGFDVASVSSVSSALNESSIHVAPNPISDLLQIDIETQSGNQLDICVLNVFGQLIAHRVSKNETKVSFDSSTWSEGVYFVFVQDRNSKISKQVVKN